jgi:uncharacterized membrane protein YfcA
VGSKLALKIGSVWVRRVFIAVVAVLILNMVRKLLMPG